MSSALEGMKVVVSGAASGIEQVLGVNGGASIV